ncbi:LCP family protein [Paenibacillus glufosinatiresistens]|uniref:LCP family protein n=1 Tax=Paenibacillus glufosinatiresistens TaxID=3070657 RepID=UPI00286E391F|nr:LCP family protein [Paenibacillus sp. YX.27]
MPPRSKRHAKKKTSKSKKPLLWTLLVLLLLVLGFAAYYFGSLYKGLDNLQKNKDESPFAGVVQPSGTPVPTPPKWEGSEPVNILLMGVDARGIKKGEVPRSDTMLVASLDPVKKKIHLFSIMRDTYTSIPGYKNNKINSAITHGPDTAVQAVSDLLGIPIQYWVYTDFQGFIKLVDAVGGVDYYVEKDMVYKTIADAEYNIDLKEGYQHLDGAKALQYVRFRHDATSDFTRTERQRAFLGAVADRLKSTTSLLKLPSILNQLVPYVDTNLSVSDMWKLASVGYDSSIAGSAQIPPNNLLVEESMGSLGDVLSIRSDDKLRAYVQDVLNAPDPSPSPAATASPAASAASGQ